MLQFFTLVLKSHFYTIDCAPARDADNFASEGLSDLGARGQPDGGDAGSRDGAVQPDKADVVVEGFLCEVLVGNSVLRGHYHPIGLQVVVDINDAEVDFKVQNSICAENY